MDLILCRNVLIYFDGETVARVARRLMDSLRDDGWLLLGGSDPPLAGLVPSDVVLTGAGLAYRRPGRGAIRPRATDVVAATFPLPPFAEPLATKRPAPSPVPPPRGEPRREPVRGERESLVQEQQALDDAADATRCYAERDYERAAELARRLVQRDGSDPALWVVLVRALANRGELEAAGRACAAALDRHRTATELVYLHALLLSEAGRHAEAAAAARRALYLDRWLVVAHLALGAAFARLGEVDGACRAFRNAKRLLTGMPPGEIVPASDGQAAGRLAEMARVQLQLLGEAAA